MKVTYRQAELLDLPRIVAIYNQAVATRLSTADLKPLNVPQKLDWFLAHDGKKQRPLWVITDETKQIVGWLSLSDFYGRPAYRHTAEISLYLDKNCQGQGIGSQAVAFVESQVKKYQLDTLLAFIFGHNQASQHLFKKFGFTNWAHLPEVALMDGVRRDLDILGKKY